MKAVLTKMVSTHENLRTNEIEGETEALPVVGERFVLIGKALQQGNGRMILTTPILSVNQISENVFEFKTKNSTYRLQILSESQWA